MKRKTKVILIVFCVLIPTLGLLIPAYIEANKSAKLISCTNHIIKLKFIIQSQKDNDGFILLPYDKDLPGYAVIAKSNNGFPGVNCNQGAPNSQCGGWQYLNLPMDTLYKLNTEWAQRNPEKDMPILWCGKGSLLQRSALILINVHKKGNIIDFGLAPKYINHKDIKSLNECLKKIGENPISFDVPYGIDWDQYLKKENANK